VQPVEPETSDDVGNWTPAARPQPDGDSSGIDKILVGLNAVLDSERQALEDTSQADFGSYTARKLQLLMQLNRLTLAHKSALFSQAIEEKLVETRRKLDENARILKHRVEAIREIAALISEEIQNAESDGTYSVLGRAREGSW
jgi:hypothetical protein